MSGRRPATIEPELVATGPNQVWSWDITKLRGPLRGPHKWTWFQLYVIVDVHSRYVVAWLVAPRESARLAEELIADAIYQQQVPAGQLALHADRGSSMTSKTVNQLLADLGVAQSHSRPHQSNDNPYSEAQFKTLKYSPTFPNRFTGIDHARQFSGLVGGVEDSLAAGPVGGARPWWRSAGMWSPMPEWRWWWWL